MSVREDTLRRIRDARVKAAELNNLLRDIGNDNIRITMETVTCQRLGTKHDYQILTFKFETTQEL